MKVQSNIWRVNLVNELIGNIEQWSIDRGLNNSDPTKQALKILEEMGETASAFLKGKHDDLIDGIGDVLVTVIIFAQQNGLSAEECLQVAYDEIKNRNGKLIDGTFVKESDLG